MLIAPGFTPELIVTRLGSVAVIQAQPDPATAPDSPHSGQRLIFIHGFGGGSSSYEWSKVYPAFRSRYRVLAPDLIGWGRSDHPARDYGLEDYLDCLLDILQQTGTDPAIVVASSLTAAMVARLASSRPELFKALILVAPTGLEDFGKVFGRNFFVQLVRTPLINRVLYWGAIATAGSVRSFLQDRQFANPDLVSDEMVQAYLTSARQPQADYAALAFVQGHLNFDLAEFLPHLSVPTLMIWGEQAQFTSVQVGEQLAALNPEAIKGFETLPDCGLTPQLEYPGITIGLIRQYLDRLEDA